MASFITASETVTAVAKINGSIARCGGQGDPKIIGRLLDEAAGINAGRVVAPAGTANLECQEPTSEALVKSAYGFSLYNPSHEAFDVADQTPFYGDNTMVSILTNGSINVDVEGTCIAGRPVLVRFTSDGGDNTELGKVSAVSDYPAGGITLTPAVANSQPYSVELFDGIVRETYAIVSGGSASAQAIVEALAALINAGTAFDATEDDSVINITSVTGVLEIQPSSNLVATNPARCAILPGAYFTESRTGAGVVEVHFERSGAI